MSQKSDVFPPKTWDGIGLDHTSPSQLLAPLPSWVFKYAYLDKKTRRLMTVGENAALGTSAHNGIQAYQCHGQTLKQAVFESQNEFDFHPANEDDVKRKHYRTLVPSLIVQGIRALRRNGFRECEDEVKIACWLDDVDVPVTGFVDIFDFKRGVFCEMKSRAPRKTRVLKSGEQGWAKAQLPKAEPDWPHTCQAAIYERATGLTPTILYVADHGTAFFTPENCNSLKRPSLDRAIEHLRQKALVRQNLLTVSGGDPKMMASLVDPDWNHQYQWNIEPDFLEMAKNLWKM